MGFLAPIGSLLGGIFGGHAAQQPNSISQPGINALTGLAGNAGQRGNNFLDLAQSAFQPAQSYYQNILQNPTSAAQAIGPQVSALQSGYQGARNQLDQFAPMGGGRSSTLANAPYALAGGVANLLAQARNQAAQTLPGIGSAQGGLGTGLMGIAGNAGNSQVNAGTTQQLLANQAGQQLGGGLYNILSPIDWGKIFKTGGGGVMGTGGGSYQGPPVPPGYTP